MPLHKATNLLRSLALLAALALFGGSLVLLYSWHQDNRLIMEAVSGHIASKPGTGMFVEELNSWVYNNQGFRKNEGYFLLKGLGATPRQVLETGGDCADKSRLLSAILRLHGIDSTLVTLYGCWDCGPTHIVVEARYDHGWMVADPVFDLVFPSGEFTYYGVEELKANPALLINRLNQLAGSQGYLSKIALYRRASETYTFAQYINWSKYPWSRNLAGIFARFDIDLFTLRRPFFLEEPKLMLSGAAAAAGIAALLFWLGMRRLAARLAARQPANPVTERSNRWIA